MNQNLNRANRRDKLKGTRRKSERKSEREDIDDDDQVRVTDGTDSYMYAGGRTDKQGNGWGGDHECGCGWVAAFDNTGVRGGSEQ